MQPREHVIAFCFHSRNLIMGNVCASLFSLSFLILVLCPCDLNKIET